MRICCGKLCFFVFFICLVSFAVDRVGNRPAHYYTKYSIAWGQMPALEQTKMQASACSFSLPNFSLAKKPVKQASVGNLAQLCENGGVVAQMKEIW